ncbi:MAG: ABC transporter ATP-binding protein [Thermoleophilaceae bacterium]
MLEVSDIHVHYGSVHALQGASVRVDAAEIVGLVGHNGVGKSTVLRAVTGLVSIAQGEIKYRGAGFDPSPARAIHEGIAYVPEDRRIFTNLSVAENLRIGATTLDSRAAARKAIEREYDRFPVLRDMAERTAGDLSGGQQQMLTIARALVAGPRLLLLDEPSLGLAPLMVAELFETLAALRHERVTVLLVEQNVAKTIALADRSYVMLPGGRVTLEGTRAELEAIPDFRRHYLQVSNGGALADG